jgi:hypothetical protein
MQLKALLGLTLMFGITVAQHSPCDTGYNHNAETSCKHNGNYACSHNRKHLVRSLG